MKKFILISSLILLMTMVVYSQEIFDAISKNDSISVQTLIEKDPSQLKLKDNAGRTPLHLAARGVHFGILKFLVEGGADINALDNNGTTALHSTSSRNHFEASKILIEKGAQVDIKNNSGMTPFYYAALNGNRKLLDYLLDHGAKKADLELRNPYGRTPLCAVARDVGNAETIKVLISLGADINAEDKSGWTPIMLAAWRVNKEVVNVLLDAGAELNVNTPKGEKLLSYAADHGLEKLFAKLLEKNASLDILNEDGGTLLHSASGGGSARIVDLLISQGFDVNKKDTYEWVPLHIASEQGHQEIISILLKKGADINARNKLGETPYNIAQDRDDKEIMSFLISNGADSSEPKFPRITGKYLGRPFPGLSREKFAPGIISHRYKPHSTVAVSPVGDEIFWNPMIESRSGGYSYGYIMTTRLENGVWTYPKKAFFSEKDFKDDHPVFSADGKRLYFASSRPSGQSTETQNSKRIWFVEKTENGWSNPKLFETQPMPSATSEMFFTFSFDKLGNYYFIVERDIYWSRFNNGKYSTPEKLSENINTGELIGCPYISPEGDYLFYYKGNPYVSFKKNDGTWTKGIEIRNSVGRTLNYSFSGNYIFTGNSSTSWVSAQIIEELKPKE